jgi:hypothetical protein
MSVSLKQVEAATKRYLKPLLGGRIVSVDAVYDDYDEAHYMVLTVERNILGRTKAPTTVRYRVWVQQDPEGNGPGHLLIEEVEHDA